MGKVIYISGPISGMPDGNREAFEEAEKLMEKQGFIVLNPRALPEGMEKRRYMPIALAMLEQADAVLMIDGWEESDGANIEWLMAIYQNKEIFYALDEAIFGRKQVEE